MASELSFPSKIFLVVTVICAARLVLGVKELPGSASLLQSDSKRDILTPNLSRLSAAMLINASDEEVLQELTAVRGLGKWSVEMFACFGLKRMDILSTGDLGVQYDYSITCCI